MGDKDKALELALTQIEKQFGKGSIMKLGQAGRSKSSKRIRRSLRRFFNTNRIWSCCTCYNERL